LLCATQEIQAVGLEVAALLFHLNTGESMGLADERVADRNPGACDLIVAVENILSLGAAPNYQQFGATAHFIGGFA
jgi:hypothetical protein